MLEESESLKKQTFLGLSKEEFGPMALLPSVVTTATSRHAAHWQSLTATWNRRKHSENSQRQDQMNRTKADDKNLYCVAVRPRTALRKVGTHGVIGVCKRVHRTQEIRYSHSGVQQLNKISGGYALALGYVQQFNNSAFHKL